MPDAYPIKILPPVEYLRQCLVYYPESGNLRWRERPHEHFAREKDWLTWNTKHAWSIASYIAQTGYLLVSIGSRRYLSHRIAWKLFTGEEPPATIDHIDGNPLNNAWDNLRQANRAEDIWNTCIRINNTSGYRGVHQRRDTGKWEAAIMINGVQLRRSFDTDEEASAWYESMAREFHGKFYRPPQNPRSRGTLSTPPIPKMPSSR